MTTERIDVEQGAKLAKKIVERLLKRIEGGTWAQSLPSAYKSLKESRGDMELDVFKVLTGQRKR